VLGAVAERAYPSTFGAIRVRYRLDESAGELWRAYCADIAAMVSCPAAVLGGLDELRAAGWRVGVATNGAADIQWAKLRATGIADHVDGAFVSEEGDARKPEVRHFALAAGRCGAVLGDGGWMVGDFTDRPDVRVDADQGLHVEERSGTGQLDEQRVWMVGDSVENDVLGGRRAGLKTIWISNGREWPLSEEAPDFIAEDVVEALNFLLALNGE
jgi:putative hydrolase of the HAD superfamily